MAGATVSKYTNGWNSGGTEEVGDYKVMQRVVGAPGFDQSQRTAKPTQEEAEDAAKALALANPGYEFAVFAPVSGFSVAS